MSGWFAAVWPVITFVLGGAAAFGRDYFTESRQDRREREARQHERDTAARDRREAFELQHLVEVNRLLHDLQEVAWEYDHEDFDDKSAHQALRAAHGALTTRVGFILDDGAREIVQQAQVAIMRNVTSPRELARVSGNEVPAAAEALAERLREIYAGQAERGL